MNSTRLFNWTNCFSLTGKVCVITGAAGLIGSSVVQALSSAGGIVVAADIVSKHNAFTGEPISFKYLDICDSSGAVNTLREVVAEYGTLDILINCAYPRTKDYGDKLEKVTDQSWKQNIDMHLNGYCLLSRAAAEIMKTSGGSIINVTSIYGLVAPDFTIYEDSEMTMPAVYSAIKGGIISFSRYLASYYAPYGVRVNSVAPGGVANNQPQEFVGRYNKKTLLGRMAQPEEIAAPILFLASPAASYITGVVLPIDGGWTAT